MDIVTHAMTAVIAATPLAPYRPLTAACVAMGCVLPDLDVLARCLGKRSFLRFHQTVTHSLVVIVVLTLGLLAVWRWLDIPESWAPLALGAGMLIHSLMDVSNTYGASLLWPFMGRRFSFAWLFFIDVTTIVITAGFCSLSLYNLWNLQSSFAPAIIYAAFVATWWTGRYLLAGRARRFAAAGMEELIPSALRPWRFYGYAIQDLRAELYWINALTGHQVKEGQCDILDKLYVAKLANIPEFRLMARLSSGYHVVNAEAVGENIVITCRDLRTRNFGGRFGMLEVTMSPDGRVERKVFHV